MDLKHTIIAALADEAIVALGKRCGIAEPRLPVSELRAQLQASHRVSLDDTLAMLRKDALVTICEVLDVDATGPRGRLEERLRAFQRHTARNSVSHDRAASSVASASTMVDRDENNAKDREASRQENRNEIRNEKKAALSPVPLSRKPMTKHSRAQESLDNWYDYPEYWEMAFADETKPEAEFIELACRKYALGPVKRLMEPGCGSGRLVMEMTKRGYHMTGFDLNVPSLEFLRGRLAKRGWKADVFEGDMANFTVSKPVDAAFNTFSTFRHLLTEEQAEGHFRSMLNALRPGGIYLLGLHLIPPGTEDTCTERWRASRGKTEVVYTFRVTGNNRKERREHIRVNMLVKKPTKQIRLVTEFDLRLYSSKQFKSLLDKFPEFELCDVFDYNLELDHPFKLDSTMSDTMLVLRKR